MRSWWRPVLVLSTCFLATYRPVPALAQGGAMPTVSLEDAVRLALEHDPATVAAEGSVASAEAGILEARGAWLPGLNINSAYANSSNQRFDQSTGRLVSESYTAQASASYELFSGGRRLFQHRSAGARLRAADAFYRAQRFQTVLRTTESFYSAVASGELVGVARQRLERARQQLEFAEMRLEVGTATRSDRLRAELEVGNAELALVDAEFAQHSACLQLGRILGVEGGVMPLAAALPEEAPALPPGTELIQRAERNSPDLLAARAALDERKSMRWETRTTYIPTLRLNAGYDWFSFSFPPDQKSWSLRLTASLPIFNGFQREASAARAAIAERSAAARARDTQLATRVAVENAVQEIASAERRVGISQRAVELAREDLRVQEERYQIGNTTIIELQTSQVALADAEAANVRSRQALGVALARLEAVLGERIGEDL
jgi:outer membrane protein TolC